MKLDLRWEAYTIPREYKAGEYIFHEGDPSDYVYYIRSGLLAINKEMVGGHSFMLNYYGPSNLVGDICVIKDLPRTTSVVATEDSLLLRISRKDFTRFVSEDEVFRQMVMDALVVRIMSSDSSRVRAATWEREVMERFASLSTEHSQMAEVIRLRHDTINFIIHDLRSPIGLAMTALNMIDISPEGDVSRDNVHMVMVAKNGMNRLMNLVDSLLDVERLESGNAELLIEEINLLELMKAILDHYRSVAGIIGASILYEVSGNIPLVKVDKIRIERVMANLLDNAIKFTGRDGTITVKLKQEEDFIQILVNDGGAGIPEEARLHVFDRFSQGGEETHQAKGFGLGLSFCKTAILAHGGKIWIEDGEEGVGAKFVFTLPIKQK